MNQFENPWLRHRRALRAAALAREARTEARENFVADRASRKTCIFYRHAFADQRRKFAGLHRALRKIGDVDRYEIH